MRRSEPPKKAVRDERLTVKRSWLKSSALLFFVLLVINSAQIMIYQAVFGIEPTLRNLLAPELVSFTLFVTAIVCAIMTIGRDVSYERPIAQLAEASRAIASGDFSVRVPLRNGVEKKDNLDILYEDFNTMAQELAGTETLQTSFITNVSHEIRTPLAVIHNYAAALKDENLTDEGREHLEVIMAASIQISAMVGNLLQLSSLETKEIIPQPASYNLSEQLVTCALAFEEKWEEKELLFEADIDEDVQVCYDRHMLEIVWSNLLSNAIKFTPPSGAISMKLKSENGYAIISVTDTGCGIDKETGKHIFTKFYQGDTSHSQEGNGLGLALVHKIIDIVGAGIQVNSKRGEGSVFTVSLKL